ncbi:MAG: phosphate/phosphite/phosphonate ABC transporter substrate-binding protein [Spirochaetia bacterium]|jgi:phosphonate transport system substrate-binding protein|nr:phosphate/phosphite/phosphonate ABC transporter substrate-binding protein [Spirochaetia bacterium]
MIFKRTWIIAAIFMIFFPLISSDADDGESKIIKFGHAYGENSAVIFNKYAPLIHLLSTELDCKIVFVLKNTYEEMQTGYLNNEIDMGIINAYSFVNIMDAPFLIPVAARVKENDKNYTSLFIVRKDSDIYSINDLKGRIFAFGDTYSTSAFLVPMYHLGKLKIDPLKFFRETVIIQKQDSIIYSVMNKTVDGGTLASFIFNEQDDAVKNKFRIIFKSDPFPLGPFVVNSNLGEEIIKKTRKFLLGLTDTEEGRKALAQADLDTFSFVEKSDYDWLKKIAGSGYKLERSAD